MRSVTRLDRVAGCALAAVEDYVPVYMRDGQAGFGGIITCGSIWACAVCSAMIRQRRAEVVEDRAKRWLEDGHGLLFVTLTRSHSMADELDELLSSELDAWKAIQQHRAWRTVAADVGYVGPLRATEITHGYNGWHPHLHLLLWFERPLDDEQLCRVDEVITALWCGRVPASAERGVVSVRVGRRQRDAAALSAYLVKMQDGYESTRPASRWSAAQEMTRGDLKRGRSKHLTPFQIAEKAAGGDKSAAALWRRYEAVTKGRRCIQWGAKLAARLEVEQASDQEVVDQVGGVVVVELSRHEWNLVRGYHSEARLLDAVERHGPTGASELLRVLFRRCTFDLSRGRPPRDVSPSPGEHLGAARPARLDAA
jgi:hypothetical protein